MAAGGPDHRHRLAWLARSALRRFLRLTAESPNRLRRARLAGESPYAAGGELDRETRETQRWLTLSFPGKLLAFGGPMKYM